MGDFRQILTIDPECWAAGQIRGAANCVLYMGLAETSFTVGNGGELSASAEAFRVACIEELRGRCDGRRVLI